MTFNNPIKACFSKKKCFHFKVQTHQHKLLTVYFLLNTHLKKKKKKR